jgi:hypothetical protein
MAIKREKPYIWVTWLTRLLSGDSSCEWSAQFKALHEGRSYSKVVTDFNATQWQIDHTNLLNKTRSVLESTGSIVYTEGQNFFNLQGKSATLSGKPDLVTINGSDGVIYDAKTGEQSVSHQIQVLIYMYALPRALPQYHNVKFEGKLIYSDNEVFIPSNGVNQNFINKLGSLIRTISSPSLARKVPSAQECRFCTITTSDCQERIESPQMDPTQLTEDF